MLHVIKLRQRYQHIEVNSTPFVRQYDILNNKWGAVQRFFSVLVFFVTFLEKKLK